MNKGQNFSDIDALLFEYLHKQLFIMLMVV